MAITKANLLMPNAADPSEFIPARAFPDKHIIEELILERCPKTAAHWTWPLTRPVLYKMLGYKKAVKMANRIENMGGAEAFRYLVEELKYNVTANRLDRVPKEGRVVIVANHPTGLADGVAVWDILDRVRGDIMFFANADALRVTPRFQETIIPVEWVMDKRSPAKTRETLRRTKTAFEDERCIVIFPSGKLAKRIDGVLTEQEWMNTAISIARKNKADIIPMNISAKNSWMYYFLSERSGELRDITLFYELLNKTNTPFKINFGPAITPEEVAGDVNELTIKMREYVSVDLEKDVDAKFIP